MKTPNQNNGKTSGPVCVYCAEKIEAGECADNRSDFHKECLFRSVAGSFSHLIRHCSCFIEGAVDPDPPGLTLREAARLAFDYAAGKVLVIFSIFDEPQYLVMSVAIWGGTIVKTAELKCASLEQARALVPKGLTRKPPSPTDIPCLVETWC